MPPNPPNPLPPFEDLLKALWDAFCRLYQEMGGDCADLPKLDIKTEADQIRLAYEASGPLTEAQRARVAQDLELLIALRWALNGYISDVDAKAIEDLITVLRAKLA